MFSHRRMSLSWCVVRLHSCERWDYVHSVRKHPGLRRFSWLFMERIPRGVFFWCSPTLLTEGHREPLINAFQQLTKCLSVSHTHPHTLHTHTHTMFCLQPFQSYIQRKETMKYCLLLEGGNWAITSQHQPEQSSTSCEMLAKCLLSSFCLSPPVWDCGSSTGTCLVVFPCQTSQATDKQTWLKQNSALLPIRSMSVTD